MQKCEEVLVKGTLTSQNLDRLCEFYTEFDPTILQIQSSIVARSYRSLTQEEQTDTCALHDVIHFLKEKKASGPLYQRSCPWPRFFYLCQQQTLPQDVPSVL